MSLTLPANTRTRITPIVAIEARRFARHPLFLAGAVAAFVTTWLVSAGGERPSDVLAWSVIPAFFIGLTSFIVAARLTRSTEAGAEAIGIAPTTEAERTLALAGACVVPFAAGILWLIEVFVALAVQGDPHPNELWFGNVDGIQVWAILISGGPVACLGGALLGVVAARWLRFPGALAVALVALVAIVMIGQLPLTADDDSLGNEQLRLWVPWASFHSGTLEDDTQVLFAGSALAYLGYQVVLCALAVFGAVWHDRTARTPRLRAVGVGLAAVAAVLLAVAVLAGPDAVRSLPIAGS